jgi:hypothetical protein
MRPIRIQVKPVVRDQGSRKTRQLLEIRSEKTDDGAKCGVGRAQILGDFGQFGKGLSLVAGCPIPESLF